MHGLAGALLLALLAGITIPLGAHLAQVKRIGPRWLEEELRHSVISLGGGVLLAAFWALVLHGPMCAFIGFTALSGYPQWLGGILDFASGGIVCLMFQDIAPQSVLEQHWASPLGAVAGFLVGLAGVLFIP